MKMAIFIATIMLLIVAALSTVPAFAWYWPILGFGPGPCPPPSYGIAPSPILPGGFEWENLPSGPAHPVAPGYTYGMSAFLNNRICFNRIPIFGVPSMAPGDMNFGNTALEKTNPGNTTVSS